MTYKQIIILIMIWAPLAIAFGYLKMRIFARVLAEEKERSEEKREKRRRENEDRSQD